MATYPETPHAIIPEDAVSQALQAIFGDDTTRADLMPKLNIVDRSDKSRPQIIGQKPLEKRIEYRLLTDSPRDKDGHLTLKGLMDTFRTLNYKEFRGNDSAYLAGARLVVTLAYFAEVGEDARKHLKRWVDSIEYDVNCGGNPCDGKRVVVGGGALTEQNCWLKGWKTEDLKVRLASDTHTDRITGTPRTVTRT